MFAMEHGVRRILTLANKTRPLLNSCVIVAVVERCEMRPPYHAKFKTHLRVTHGITVQFAIVSDRDSRKSAGTRFVHRFDHQIHVRCVLDFQIEAGMPPASALDNFQNGFHAATSANPAVPVPASSKRGGSNAARMTPEV